ncbi:RHS repeat-associated core domain-containing protein [Pseudomonas putida]|uniref:RHS repeat-associated core domain-containing protein n=1 Tax=Pseudomonas putida TaxID=303 RepID=UPI0034D65826
MKNLLPAHAPKNRHYCPYGYSAPPSTKVAQLGYHGEYLLPVFNLYLLGNGYRCYSPALRRFFSSDTASPFGRGGLNSYAALAGDPINFKDPDGHAPVPMSLAHTKNRLNIYASTFVERRRAFVLKEGLQHRRVLQSQLPERPGRSLLALQAKQDVSAANFSIVGSAHDLQNVKKRAQKFIFTNEAEFIIGETSKAVDFAHPHLTYLATGNKEVISAGMIMKDQSGYSLSNDTGHYHESAAGLDTMAAPLVFLQSIGVNAIRHPARQ